MAVEVGDQAPDFELRDQHGTPVRLSGFRGAKNVVLVFYPLAFSGVCTGELCAIRDEFPEVVTRLEHVDLDPPFARPLGEPRLRRLAAARPRVHEEHRPLRRTRLRRRAHALDLVRE